MEIKRLWHQIRIAFIPSSQRITEYLKKHKVFHYCGENVYIHSRKIPLYANLIALHNNIRIASSVSFVTHDVMHTVFTNMERSEAAFYEKLGCIEIRDNVFIGSNTTIMYGTRIGPNAIVAAGSVVTKDVPPGEIWGGVPARKIGMFDELMDKRKNLKEYPYKYRPQGQIISPQLEAYLWEQFQKEE